ncbi:hypothetical protein [Legionella sp. W05-934-2]|jgi:hypothetical protein|uniref:hypothetical protein n=1 Tax=Legionella sp. W05-934-2 TaxID=1198649 RepID=UPI00346359DD
MPHKHSINQRIEDFLNLYYPKFNHGLLPPLPSEEEIKQRDEQWNTIMQDLLAVKDLKKLNEICFYPLDLSKTEIDGYAQSIIEYLSLYPNQNDNFDMILELIDNGLLISDASMIMCILRQLMPSWSDNVVPHEKLENLMGKLTLSHALSFNQLCEIFKKVLKEKTVYPISTLKYNLPIVLSTKQKAQNQLALKWLDNVQHNLRSVALAYEFDPDSLVHQDLLPRDMLGHLLPLKSAANKPTLTPHADSYSGSQKASSLLLLLARERDDQSLLHQDYLPPDMFKLIMLEKLDETVNAYASFLRDAKHTSVNADSIIKESMSYLEEIIDTMIFLHAIGAISIDKTSASPLLPLLEIAKIDKRLPYDKMLEDDTAPSILDIVLGNTSILISNVDQKRLIGKLAQAGLKVSDKVFAEDTLRSLPLFYGTTEGMKLNAAILGLDALGLSIVDNLSWYESIVQQFDSDDKLVNWLKEKAYRKQESQKSSDLSSLSNVLNTGRFSFLGQATNNHAPTVTRSQENEDISSKPTSHHQRNNSR